MRRSPDRGSTPAPAVFLVGALWCALVSGLGCASAPSDRPAPVGRTVRDWSDPARTRWDGSGTRPLQTTIWYPAVPGARETATSIGPPGLPFFRFGWVAPEAPMAALPERLPVILLSHGTGGSALDLSWLAEPLAARGHLVAAVTHHGNSIAADDLAPQGFYLWWERARDLTQILERLERDSAFGDRLDLGRVGAAGFSLGGHTVVLLGGARVDLAAFRARCEEPDALASSCQPPPEGTSPPTTTSMASHCATPMATARSRC